MAKRKPKITTSARRKTAVDRVPGRFAYEGLDRVIHEKARLGILTSLAVHPQGLVFGDLKELCALTDGNLSRHLAVLADAGLVEVWKGVHRNRPQTLCRLTPEGKRRFLEYVAVLEHVVVDAARAEETTEPSRPNRPRSAWANT